MTPFTLFLLDIELKDGSTTKTSNYQNINSPLNY